MRTRQGLDFALFTIDAVALAKQKEVGYLALDPNGAKPGQKMYIPQFSEVDGEVSKAIILSDDTQGPELPGRIGQVYPANRIAPWLHSQPVQYTADTKPGASGAPVISADLHEVVALHNGSNLNNTANAATNMSSIWEQIKDLFINCAANTHTGALSKPTHLPEQIERPRIGDRRLSDGRYKNDGKVQAQA